MANRIALPAEQRIIVELGDIEDDARCAKAMIDAPPPEPSTLIAARTALTETGQRVQALQTKLDGACATVQQLQQRRPWWQRAVGVLTGDNVRRTAEIRAAVLQQSKAQAALVEAKNERSKADNRLTREVQRHRDSVREHVEKWTQAARTAEVKAASAARARELLRQLPGATALGAAGLCEIAAKLAPRLREQQLEADDSGERRLAAQP